MHLLVLGATGKSGAYGLKYALEEGQLPRLSSTWLG
jgi:uncharacterized protein YbjT (DUF2867 family)